MNQIEMLSEPNMRAAFDMFDRDGSGMIDANELEAILGESIKIKSSTAWQDILSEFDLNADGMIDFQEFKTMLILLADRISSEQ